MSLRTFTAEVLRDIETTAAVAPSSRYLTRAMVAPLPLARARCVVEFGPGTGAMTRALLDALPEDATLLAFEINPRFRHYLGEHFSDPRLAVIPAGAECVGQELAARGIREISAAISSLGLTSMPEERRHAILRGLVPFLAPGSAFTQFMYLHAALVAIQPKARRIRRFNATRFLRGYFPRVTYKVVWRNLPPAFAFTCHR
ncbi:MAG: class I SAM-dependent methyltransferase [Terriglobia bacterium]